MAQKYSQNRRLIFGIRVFLTKNKVISQTPYFEKYCICFKVRRKPVRPCPTAVSADRQAGGVVNTYKNAMQYKENYLQILMSMIIV